MAGHEKTDLIDAPGMTVITAPSAQLVVVEGADSGREVKIELAPVSVGTHPSCALKLRDRKVSRFHFDVSFAKEGIHLRDLGSTNGTFVSGIRVRDGFLCQGSLIRAGETVIEVSVPEKATLLSVHPEGRLGSLVGSSVPMRRLFADIVRLAPLELPILIQGETGTGKEVVAREVHAISPRHTGPFVVVDCGAIPPDLAESELFGHIKGSFTGATADRKGAFETANGGTLFLDEVGELDVSLQPRLLRAVEAKQVKRVGSDKHRGVDVRVVAATHRDLRSAVNDGTFREDLYYRLAVGILWIPAVRERIEDLPLLIEHFYKQFFAESGRTFGLASGSPAIAPETMARLRMLPWNGNVREVRNFVERSLAYAGDLRATELMSEPPRSLAKADRKRVPDVRVDIQYKDARAEWLDHFERIYVTAHLREANGSLTRAAAEMGIDRGYLFRLMKKLGIR